MAQPQPIKGLRVSAHGTLVERPKVRDLPATKQKVVTARLLSDGTEVRVTAYDDTAKELANTKPGVLLYLRGYIEVASWKTADAR